jgi:hypothetical protein
VLIAAARSVGPAKIARLAASRRAGPRVPDQPVHSPGSRAEDDLLYYKKRLEQSFYARYFNNAVWFHQLDKIDALLRQQLFFYRDLWAWLDAPFEAPPALAGVHDDGQQLEITW